MICNPMIKIVSDTATTNNIGHGPKQHARGKQSYNLASEFAYTSERRKKPEKSVNTVLFCVDRGRV